MSSNKSLLKIHDITKNNQNERTSAKVTRRSSEAYGVRIASFLSLLASDNARLERRQTAVMLKLDHQ